MTSSGVLGNVTFSTRSGIKQGGSTSCNSFTGYIAPTIDAVKSCGPDIWHSDIHILLFIEDSVILASSRYNDGINSPRTISQRSGDFYIIGTNSSILMLKDYMSEQC